MNNFNAKIKDKKILITNGGSRSAYAALRNLTKYGAKCYIADKTRVGMSQFSKRKYKFCKYTCHYLCEKSFMADVTQIIKKEKIDFILPTHNETEVISRNKHKLPKSVKYLVPSVEHSELFNNKSSAYHYVSTLSIPIPARISYTSTAELEDKLSEFRDERFVVKLLTGNSSKGVFHTRGTNETVAKVKSLIDKFKLKLDRLPQVEHWVDGEGFGHSCLYLNGEKLAGFTHRRLREKVSTGGTSTLRCATFHSELEKAAELILGSLKYNGLAMCEFKVCRHTGQYWFIEVNPRMWGSIPLSISAGIEFPVMAYLTGMGFEKEAFELFQKSNVKCGWVNKWLLGELFLILSSVLKADFATLKSLIFNNKCDGIDDFYLDDPFVFFGEVLSYIINVVENRSTNPQLKGMVG